MTQQIPDGSFYVVARWTEAGPAFSTKPFQHGSHENAEREAKRLALEHGETFLIFEATHVVDPPRVSVRKLDNIPF